MGKKVGISGRTYFSGFGMGYINEFGEEVARTPMTNPYTYDGYIIYRNGKNEEADDSVWSDRLYQWDAAKHDRLSKKHFGNAGNDYSGRDAKKIEAFLSDYFDKRDASASKNNFHYAVL